MDINVSVVDGNNIVCQVTPTPQEVITIDRGVAGVGIASITPITVDTLQYLRITYTNGVVQDVGPLTSTAYFGETPIQIVGNTISLTTVPISLGGTGSSTAAGAPFALKGANSDITSMSGITGAIGTADYVQFDTAYATTLAAGQLGWDGNDTLGLGMIGGNVIQRIGEDFFYYIKASSAITKGQVIMFTGAVGASGVVAGAPAYGVTDGSYIMGIAAESIALNGFGLVQFQGTLKGFDTSAFTDGEILWYNPAVTGGLTGTKPSAPNVKVQMAAVIHAGNGGSGSALIRVNAGSVLGGTDSNVQFGTLATNNLIQYNGTYWSNIAPSALTGVGSLANALTIGTGLSGTSYNGSSAITIANTGVLSFSGGATGLTPSAATSGAITLAGTLAVANGGTGITSFGTGVATALGVNVGTAGAFVVNGGALGTPSSGTVTNLTGTASININGTVGATTPNTGAFTTLSASGAVTLSGGTANGVGYLNASKVFTTGSALTFDGTTFNFGGTAQRITGDMSSTPLSNRLYFQNSVANATTSLGVIPSGTGTSARVNIFNSSAPDNSSYFQFAITATDAYLLSAAAGTGTALPLGFNVGGSTRYNIATNGESIWSIGSEQMRLSSTLLSVVPGATIQGITVGKGAGGVATNTVVGASALAANTTGDASVAVGYQALTNNTTGQQQVAVGYQTLLSNTTGANNVAIGRYAIGANTTGGNNTALGWFALASNTTANNNTAVGYQAGYNNTTGTSNIAIGSQSLGAGSAGVTGAENVGIGYQSLSALTSGNNNIAIADYALRYTTTGSNNVAIGLQALQANTTANGNTAVGYQAGYTNTTGIGAVALGYQALYSASDGYYPVAVGYRAGRSYTGTSVNEHYGSVFIGFAAGYATGNANDNVFIGGSAGTANTTGAFNTALGSGSLYASTTNSGNTAAGYQSAYSLVAGTITAVGFQSGYNTNGASSHLTAFGYQAGFGYSNVSENSSSTYIGFRSGYNGTITGRDNTFVGGASGYAMSSGSTNAGVGAYAMFGNTTGSNNAVLGYYVMANNTTGSNNTAVGREALQANTTANRNSAFGYQSLYTNSTGAENSALGHSSLYYNTTGSYNVAIGGGALQSNTDAQYNTAIGYQAGYTSSAGAGSGYNTFVGASAGKSVTTGGFNTFVGARSYNGYGAGELVTTGAKNTILGGYSGNQGGLDIRTASNYIVLSDGDGNPRLWHSGSALSCPTVYSVTTASTPNVFVDSAGGIYRGGVSALKYKQDIRDLEEIDISLIRAIRYKSKCEIDDQTKDYFGVVADEVADAGIEELVTRNADGEVEGFQYERLTVVLLKKLQVLEAEVKALKGQA